MGIVNRLLCIIIIPLIGLILAFLCVDQSSFWIISFVILVFIIILKIVSPCEYNGDDIEKDVKIVIDIIDVHTRCYNELVTNHFYSYNGRKMIDELELKSGIYIEEILKYYGIKHD